MAMVRTSSISLCAAAAAGVLLVLAGCSGSGGRHASASNPDSLNVAASPSATASAIATPAYTGPHFDSPEAAMRYLAAAWNRHDIVAMKRVTTPDGRAALIDMYDEAVNLRSTTARPERGRATTTATSATTTRPRSTTRAAAMLNSSPARPASPAGI
jgi:hypothetical protein